MELDIGIPEKDRQEITLGLSRLLSDTYSLYLKSHYYHWNVIGPMFQPLHLMFEAHYTELAVAVDLIAERIRALGFPTPGTYSEFGKLSTVKNEPGVPKNTIMIKNLVEAHETVTHTARSVFPIAERAKDEATVDVLTQRLHIHEKTAWMLRSMLE